jgi:hypothetical protein
MKIMNEDQPDNDHRLHIDPCPCGHPHPEVSGDDFDADVYCPKCSRITPNCLGTRGAIYWWNKNRFSNEIEFLDDRNAEYYLEYII